MGSVLTGTVSNFEAEVIKSEELVIVDFWASWCMPCKMLAPILDEISEEEEGVKVVKVNVDDEGDLATKYGIRSIPSLKFFKGGEIVDESVGVVPKPALIEKVKANK